MGAFDAAGLAMQAVGGAEHQGAFFKAIDLARAEIFAGVNAEITFTATALAGVGEGDVGRLVFPVGGA